MRPSIIDIEQQVQLVKTSRHQTIMRIYQLLAPAAILVTGAKASFSFYPGKSTEWPSSLQLAD